MAKREGRWDCDKCRNIKILGRNKWCPNCGGQRPKNVHFYLLENEPEVTDPKRLAEANAGPDWTCLSCEQDNPWTADFCGQCGAPKDDAVSRPVIEYGLDDIPRSGEPEAEPPDYEEAESVFIAGEDKGNFFDRISFPAVIAGGIALFAILGFMLFGTHTEPLTVVGHTWQRVVHVEEYRTVQESDWSIPMGGRYVSEGREIHHYDRVISGSHDEPYQDCNLVYSGSHTESCGSIDLGNGYFEDRECSVPDYDSVCTTEYRTVNDYESVPVFQTRYYYDIERWVWNRDETSTAGDTSPYWPEFLLSDRERESGRNEHYVVHLIGKKDKPYDYATDYSTWISLQDGAVYEAKINGFGAITEILENK